MWQRIGGALLILLLVLSAYAAYANVFADDTAVRARAEQVARDKAGCGKDCTITRTEGSRGVLTETLTYTFVHAGVITVSCRRPYIAFGAHVCTVGN